MHYTSLASPIYFNFRYEPLSTQLAVFVRNIISLRSEYMIAMLFVPLFVVLNYAGLPLLTVHNYKVFIYYGNQRFTTFRMVILKDEDTS